MNKQELLKGGMNALFRDEALTEREKQLSTQEQEQEQAASTTDVAEGDLLNDIADEDMRAAIIEHRKRKRGRPRKTEAERVKEGQHLYTRGTFIMNKEQLELLRVISHRERITMKDLMETILNRALTNYQNCVGKAVRMRRVAREDISHMFSDYREK